MATHQTQKKKYLNRVENKFFQHPDVEREKTTRERERNRRRGGKGLFVTFCSGILGGLGMPGDMNLGKKRKGATRAWSWV